MFFFHTPIKAEVTMKEREQFIIDYVKEHHFATSDELSNLLSVTPVTIRRDLNRLHKENILYKVHGGVIFQKPKEPKTVKFRSAQAVADKRSLAKYIAENMVKPGETIFLDAGSTTHFIAEELINLENLTIITHSLPVINLLKDIEDNMLIGISGEYNRRVQAFVGPLAEESYEKLRADKAFIGANIIDLDLGCYDNTGFEKRIKNLINSNARDSYLVLDRSKFNNDSGLFLTIKKENICNIITTLPKDDKKLKRKDLDNINFIFVDSHSEEKQ